MKTACVIALIVVGGILIITPLVFGQLHEANLVRSFEKAGASSGTSSLERQHSQMYSFGCWLTGSSMIGVGVYLALLFSRQTASGPVTPERPTGPA